MAVAHRLFSVLCFSISLLSVATAAATAAANTADLIHEACSHTLYVDLCVKSLSADPTSHKADVHGLATIALNLAAKSGAATSGYISGLLKGVGDNPDLEQCLSDCAESYVDAGEHLHDSMSALNAKAYADVNTWVSAAMTDTDTCDDGCKEMGKSNAGLETRNADFNKLCSITLTLTNLIPKTIS